jgi:hypothetical protein
VISRSIPRNPRRKAFSQWKDSIWNSWSANGLKKNVELSLPTNNHRKINLSQC